MYTYNLYGRENLIASMGDPGLFSIYGGGYGATNNTASVFPIVPHEGGGDGFSIANDIIGGADLVNGLVGFDAAINSTLVYRYARRISGRVLSAAELTATNQAKALKVLNASKSIGNKLGVAGGIVIAGDVLYNSEIKVSHGINAIMTGIAFTGWGAQVAGIWFVADFGTGLITGKSISIELILELELL